MNVKSLVGLLLVLGGALALVFQGITYTRDEKVVDLGPLEVTAESKERIPISPIAASVALAGGVVLLLTGSRKS